MEDGNRAQTCRTPSRTYVVADLGRPVQGRLGYRGLGTVTAPDRVTARALVDAVGFEHSSRGPVRVMTPRVAGLILLIEALVADARGTG